VLTNDDQSVQFLLREAVDRVARDGCALLVDVDDEVDRLLPLVPQGLPLSRDYLRRALARMAAGRGLAVRMGKRLTLPPCRKTRRADTAHEFGWEKVI
jgi:hypothetical protein